MNSLVSKVFLGHYSIPETLSTILDHNFQIFDTITQDAIDRLEQTKYYILVIQLVNVITNDKNTYCVVGNFRLLLCDTTLSKVLHNMEALNFSNYVDRFHLLMWIEEHQAHKDMLVYNQVDVDLLTDRREEGLYGIEVYIFSFFMINIFKYSFKKLN